jgi:hypothetical protein
MKVTGPGCTRNKCDRRVNRAHKREREERHIESEGVHVFRLPPGYLDIFPVSASKAHAVGRTVDGRLGVGVIKGRNGHRIDQVGGKGARLGNFGFGKALRALGVAANDLLPGHFAGTFLLIKNLLMTKNQCPMAQTPPHGCPTTRPRSKHWGDVRKFKKKAEARGKREEKGRKKTQAARHQPVEHARVHGSKKGASSDVADAVTKFEAIRPSRSCTWCRCTWPPSTFWSAPTTRSEGGTASTLSTLWLSSLLLTVLSCMHASSV